MHVLPFCPSSQPRHGGTTEGHCSYPLSIRAALDQVEGLGPQARATPSWWTHNKCCPHSLLPGIEYSRHVTPWAISRAPHYRLKSIKVFSLITSRTLPKKGMHSGIYMTFLKIIRTSMTRYICALAVVFFKLRWHKQPQVRLQNFQYYCLRCNRLVCRMTPWVSVRFVRVPQCSTAGRHVISGKRRNYDMYCHVV